MRSYYSHLETAMGVSQGPIVPKPVLRSSAIFPVFHREGISSRIIFMGYWLLKRNIHELTAVITLRSLEGKILARSTMSIKEAKTFRLELSDQLTRAGIPLDQPFEGSLEIEFYSTVNLVFPYPAVAINYYGPQFSTVVHTAQRVYNDFDDMQKNSQTDVPESGFNIYADETREPFLGLINGAAPVPDAKIQMEFFNSEGQSLQYVKQLGDLAPYQTVLIYPAKETDLKKFLKGKVGAGKVRFHVNWIFPRLLVGNIQHSLPALSITHTYYDCTKAVSDSDYWRPTQPEWYPASLMIPVSLQDEKFTNIYLYPIYSPSEFNIDVEIYDSNGKLLGKKEKILTVKSPSDAFLWIKFKDLCQELGIKTDRELAARIIGRTSGDSRFPARVKLGLDLGDGKDPIPCNICTNLQPFNPAVESKPKSFKWGPVLADQPGAAVWIMNSAPNVDYQKEAEIELTFFREEDSNTITRILKLPPHGFHVIRPDIDPELDNFFHGTVGWFTAVTNNSYTTTYYFAEHASGAVGGDHGF